MRINKIINKEILSWYVTELSDLILTEVCDIHERRIYLNEKSSFYMIQDPKSSLRILTELKQIGLFALIIYRTTEELKNL